LLEPTNTRPPAIAGDESTRARGERPERLAPSRLSSAAGRVESGDG